MNEYVLYGSDEETNILTEKLKRIDDASNLRYISWQIVALLAMYHRHNDIFPKPQSMQEEMNQLHKAGCNIITLYDYPNPPFTASYTNQILTLASNAGFKKAIILGADHCVSIGIPQNQAEEDQLANQIANLQARLPYVASRAAELGFTDVYIYCIGNTGFIPNYCKDIVKANNNRFSCVSL